ncbi:hypothetical protein [Burkholderia thailandensis]|uniref:hypothetical protein n=1 Tax=Burkholderia thailandensis TaxID=57975 RepID=UPI00107ED17B|nr:hypothetical protein [Burkholderia thailandensis]TGB34375.1 hypothetical protein C6946_07030 [Burkholderia thailandensis]
MSTCLTPTESIELTILRGLLPHQLADEIDDLSPVEWGALKELFARPESPEQAAAVERIVRRLFEAAIAREYEMFFAEIAPRTSRRVHLFDEA